MILKTKRLIIRPFVYEDLKKLIEILTDPLVMSFLGGPRSPNNIKEQFYAACEYFDKHQVGLMALIEKKSNALMGRVGFIQNSIEGTEEFELVWILAKEYWDQGYATEAATALGDYAFAKLQKKHFISIIAQENQRSLRVAQKIGMICEKEIVFKEMPAYLFRKEKKSKSYKK